MALPNPGVPLSFSDLKEEFDDTEAVSFSEFYRGFQRVPNAPANDDISNVQGGELSMSDFYGATNEIIASISSPVNNINMSSYFSPSVWSSGVPKRLIIESGVVIGSTSTSNPALTISGGSGPLSLDNNGNIYGMGGAGGVGNGSPGQPGGPAISANRAVAISNAGTIYAGGGGGGAGGVGGSNKCSPSYGPQPKCPGRANPYACGGGSCAQGGFQNNNCFPLGNCGSWCQARCAPYPCRSRPAYPKPAAAGGPGGSGGRGTGYTGSSTGGSNGSRGPTCTGPDNNRVFGSPGGKGSAGAGWGQSASKAPNGNNGNNSSGGSGGNGGKAGNYIINDSNVTWVDGRGAVAGRVA